MTLILTIRIYNQDVGMEFIIEKPVTVIMKNGKREATGRTELPNQESTKTFAEKKNYKYLGILEWYSIKPTDIKEKI